MRVCVCVCVLVCRVNFVCEICVHSLLVAGKGLRWVTKQHPLFGCLPLQCRFRCLDYFHCTAAAIRVAGFPNSGSTPFSLASPASNSAASGAMQSPIGVVGLIVLVATPDCANTLALKSIAVAIR